MFSRIYACRWLLIKVMAGALHLTCSLAWPAPFSFGAGPKSALKTVLYTHCIRAQCGTVTACPTQFRVSDDWLEVSSNSDDHHKELAKYRK